MFSVVFGFPVFSKFFENNWQGISWYGSVRQQQQYQVACSCCSNCREINYIMIYQCLLYFAVTVTTVHTAAVFCTYSTYSTVQYSTYAYSTVLCCYCYYSKCIPLCYYSTLLSTNTTTATNNSNYCRWSSGHNASLSAGE